VTALASRVDPVTIPTDLRLRAVLVGTVMSLRRRERTRTLARIGGGNRADPDGVDQDGWKVTSNNSDVGVLRRWFRLFRVGIVLPAQRYSGVNGRHEASIEKSTSS
jgi:hypothetical protein